MKQKKGFQRLTIDQMKALKKEKELQHIANEVMSSLDERIEEEAEKLAQELVDSGMDVDEFFINVEVYMRDGKLAVRFNVVQEAREIVLEA